MKQKKLLCMALVGIMGAGLLAGCGSSKEVAKTADGKTKLKALYIAHPLTEDPEEMKWLQEMEDAAGVDVEWEVLRADWDTVKSTRLASGDVPDILFNATVDSDYIQYNSLFVDLNEHISSEKTPNITKMFEEEPDTKVLSTTPEGKIFGLPKFQGKWPSTNTVMFINKKWLDKCKLEVPKTFSELETALKAFRDEDCNGNGDKSDEIPLDYNGSFNGAYSLFNLMGGMGIQLTDWGTDAYFAEDGKVKCYAVDDRYKDFMKYIHTLYSEKLINPNGLTNDYSAFQSLSRGDEAGNALVGCVFGWEETDKFGAELSKDYVPVPALDYDIDCAAGTYDTRWRNDYTGLNLGSNRVCVSKNCKNIDAAMKFVDQFYQPANSVQVLFGGITDGCVEKVSDTSFKVLPPLDKSVDAGTWKWTKGFADFGPMYIPRTCDIEMAEDMQNAIEERKVYDDTLAKASDKDTYPQMFMKYSEEEQNTMAMAQANITQIIDNQWSLWMTGDADIDATWDEYVKSVKNAGLEDVLKIRQKAFDKYLSEK